LSPSSKAKAKKATTKLGSAVVVLAYTEITCVRSVSLDVNKIALVARPCLRQKR
jgi:hypothetical protein